MYVMVQLKMGATNNPIVPIRHFTAARAKLSDAVKSGNFFTSLDDAMFEAKQLFQGAKELSVLLDSTLAGRDRIIKGPAKTGLKTINDAIAGVANQLAQVPVIQGPDFSGFTLFFGLKTVQTAYPRPIIDVSTWRRFFTKPGAYIELSGPSFERRAVEFNNNTFDGVTLRRWSTIIHDGP
jgi:hypothetical protein